MKSPVLACFVSDSPSWKLVLIPPVALALFGFVSHLQFLLDGKIPCLVLPACVFVATFLLFLVRHQAPTIEHGGDANRTPPNRAWILFCLFVILGALAFATWSTLATPSRSWDGLASWELRSQALGSPADLSSPFYSDPRVYAHSRSYPLLQPLIVASMSACLGADLARIFFPLLFACLLALVGVSGRRAGLSTNQAFFLVLAAGLTPLWYDVGPGSIDSGIGDLLLSYALTLGAIGLLLREKLPLLLACLLLPWIKPEGTVFALLFLALLAWEGRRSMHLFCTLALAISLQVWLPLRARLEFQAAGLEVWAGPILLLLSLAGAGLLARMPSRRTRWITLATGLSILLILGLFLGPWLAKSHDPLLSVYFAHITDLPSRLLDLPELLWGSLRELLAFKRFGLVFVLLPWALFSASRCEDGGDSSLARFVWLALLIAFVAVLLGPAHDQQLQFADRLTRILLQLVATSWLLIVVRLLPEMR